ncbi:MAG: DNA-binding response regulator [Rhodanobacter sp. 68-29]|mgnify:CR=1 FL=1|uniref:sigma-54-dependent transcriptional regulator n=1 Tax=Rhodanobacter sp. PCA2 TaxID=2006117 RepID=UPI000929F210|nr:sigma-54 dependent transcriptional regulator [Rhodanobacter sp. PCA2]MBA2078755.1 DNA-binding response regulator [Rhodanobacter sp. PCA2]MBN8924917.1 sigma-54-dependent Fis family transcriptional regulator [Rhodanobacter sp.]OJY56268.1 MAG: DNA-binding response regulator [Rhodanobacter sp. 68-29]
MNTKRILVVDNEAKMRRILELSLRNMGHEVLQAGEGEEALRLLERESCDLVLTDLRMPRMDGIELLKALRARGDDVPVIMLTAYGTIETAVSAMKLGAADYIIRPFEMETIELAVTRVLEMQAVQRENRFLRDELSRGWGEFVGVSDSMQALYRLLEQVAPTRSSVFIVGETGTGKELVARALHQASNRSGLFVPINCAAIPTDLLESELFGHAKGAFTGALRDRVGKCELSSGGTLFLDEITEMPPVLQAKLLRVLQDGSIERLGANTPIAVDLRVIAATNRDPLRAVEEGRLRRDLYFRLNVVRVDVPLLRERSGDIPLLAEHFLHQYARELGRSTPQLSAQALQRLEQYNWPGNVRELENLIERAMVLCRGDEIGIEHFPPEISHANPATAFIASETATKSDVTTSLAMKPQVEAIERHLIAAALARSDGNKAAAARLLEVSERALWYKLKRYEL